MEETIQLNNFEKHLLNVFFQFELKSLKHYQLCHLITDEKRFIRTIASHTSSKSLIFKNF